MYVIYITPWYSNINGSLLGPSNTTGSAPELEYFAAAGYDAVALGNHDFDAGVDALKRMLTKIKASPSPSPSPSTPSSPAVLSANLNEVLPGVAPYTVKEYSTATATVRIGIFGLLSPDAAFASRANRRGQATFTGYDDVTEARNPEAIFALATAIVSKLRADESCDLVVALYHGGRCHHEESSAERRVKPRKGCSRARCSFSSSS